MSNLFNTKKIKTDNEQKSSHENASVPIPIDAYRKKDRLIILAPIAGITIEDITVTISEDIITIKGSREKPDETHMQDVFSEECFWGEFQRSIVIPVSVDTDKVAAYYKQGILRIEMPILEERKTRVIPIKIEEE